jgi:hypothetical protein
MSYNGSGTFQINTSGQPVVTGTVISSSAFNALTADLATGLSTAITKDGQTATTVRIPFAQGINSSLATDTTSGSTGSIYTAGGVGITKGLFVGGTATFSATPVFSALTASSAVATDASKNLVSVANTGTGSNVLATSPTLVTPALGTPSALVGTNITGTATSFNINGTVGATTPSTGAFTTLTATKATAGDVATFTNAAASNKTGFIYTDNRFVGLFTAAGGGGSGFAVDTSIPSVYIQVGGAAIATATAAGFAVTGTLSATTTGKVGTTLGVGNATPSGSGSGITFPATQSASTDANTLDDYEEGSWTPVFSGYTGTYNNQNGKYVKIGQLVYIECLLQPGTVTFTTPSNVAAITGLPFAAISFGYIGSGPGSLCSQGVSFNLTGNDQNATGTPNCIATSSSTIQFAVTGSSGGARGNVLNSAFASSSISEFSCNYRTT